MGAHPLGQPVPNRTGRRGHGFQAPKGALHCRQTLIRADSYRSGRGSLLETLRADHIDPYRVPASAARRWRIAGIAQLRIGDRDLEVLAHLETIPHLLEPRKAIAAWPVSLRVVRVVAWTMASNSRSVAWREGLPALRAPLRGPAGGYDRRSSAPGDRSGSRRTRARRSPPGVSGRARLPSLRVPGWAGRRQGAHPVRVLARVAARRECARR